MELNRPIIGPVKIDEIHSSGKGVATWNEKKYYIPHALLGEEYFVITENRRLGFRTAKIISIDKSSNIRIIPPCKYYGLCGGCNFMHIDYQGQLTIKQNILKRAFEKYQITSDIPDAISTSEPLNYRNKATFKVLYSSNRIQIGFHPEWTKNELIEIETCYLLKPIINEYFLKISYAIRQFNYKKNNSEILSFTLRSNSNNKVMLIIETKQQPSNELHLFFNQLATILKPEDSFYYFIKPIEKNTYPYAIHIQNTAPFLYQNILYLKLRISPFTFFQNNIEITEKILFFIKKYIDFNITRTIFDLYSGNGTMSLPLIQGKKIQLWAIEGNLSAINDAMYNSLNNPHHHHILGDVLQTFTPDFLTQTPRPDLIIIDPPRSGTLIEIQKNIIKANPNIIVYISCNPVSLAWNLQQLTVYYRIKHLKIFDMFPQTHQFETVVILERIKGLA